MKINNRYLAMESRDEKRATAFWKQIMNNFIEGAEDITFAQMQGMSLEQLKSSRKMMVATAHDADVVAKCPIFFFTNPAQELSKKIDVNKIPLGAFHQVTIKAGKIITAKKEFFMWTFLDHKDEVVLSRYWTEDEGNGMESINFTYSTIDFSADKMRTNPYEEWSQELDRRARQLLFFLFLADNTRVELKPGRSNALPRAQGKILNDSSVNIIEVRSDFNITKVGMVSGHYRNQPYGPRTQPKYKLIYIEAHKKEYRARSEELK